MILQGALISEQGVTFGIIVVKAHVTQNSFEANRFITAVGSAVFPGTPVVLMSQDHRGVPTFYGRRDIAQFLSGVPIEAIPWRQYTIS
jgi:hypothetical protein